MTISKTDIVHFLQYFCDDSSRKPVSEAVALAPECAGGRMYDWPLVGVSSARDALYKECKRADVAGKNHMLPSEWLDSAKSVISIFNPFTQQIKANNAGGVLPSLEWLHGRFQGQEYIVAAAQALAEHLRSQGAQAMVPAADKRFEVYKKPKIYSNWSDRHKRHNRKRPPDHNARKQGNNCSWADSSIHI